ncbi:MAG: hypothetical protein GY862_13425, partial [Gammaproteobacteria bacterium]|nr:hypothetical protein [Gammaproteobacteria bacterium]
MTYATLMWVKPAIDDTLKQTRQSLEQFVENPDDTRSLQDAVGWLREIRGALTLMETSTACLLVGEMEHVTQALLDNKVANKESAYDILMRGLIQLPNYLDHLALGYPDIPMALLPLLNKLRALRKQAPLPATSLFTPDLSVNSPAAKPAPKMADIKLRQFVHRLRASYHK